MLWAITPRGAGRKPGARAIQPGWDLVEGEAFAVATDSIEGLVLAEDGQSLRPGTSEELSSRRLVSKSLIVERLNAAGLLAAAKAALDANLYARERWYAPDKPAIYADDAEALALLAAIGANPEIILAQA